MLPGFRLRQARERLGLTYRDVERASYELAARRGRPDFIVHISRLADIENRGVVPGLHKLYTLAAIYRLNPLEIFRWYDVPIEECFHDGASFAVPQTHLMAAPTSLRIPMKFDPSFDPRRTEFLSRMVEKWGNFEGVLTNGHSHHFYGYIGTSDRRMMPLLRPGSIVLVDSSVNEIDDGDWTTEHDRPMYFVEVPPGRVAAGDAAPSAVALYAGDVARAGRSGNRGASDGRSYALERAGERSSSRISRRARRLEQKSSLRYSGAASG